MKINSKNTSFVKIVKIIVPMFFKACPKLIILMILVNILHGISLGINTLAIQKFFDYTTLMIKEESNIKMVLLSLTLLCIAILFNQIMNGLANFMSSKLVTNKAIGILGKILNEKSSKLNAIDFENTNILDDINKAQQGLENSIFINIRIISIATFYLPYFLFMGIYLYKLKPILSIAIILIFAPITLGQIVKVKLFGNLEEKIAPVRREYEYYERCIIDKEFYKETRLLGAFQYFKKIYKSSLLIMNNEILRVEKKTGLIEIFMKSLTLLGYVAVLILLIKALLDESISVGAFGAVFTSIGTMFKLMEEIVCRHIGRINKRLGTVKNFIFFLELDEISGENIEINESPGIEIKNVDFIYPCCKNLSLKNINLKINKNETIAIVGENGSGKSTLVKLIIGMYKPIRGEVLVNGIDTKNISNKSLYKNISGVFQNFKRYKMTLRNNICISENLHCINNELLQEAITRADFNIDNSKLLNGYDTFLCREFDGIDLSGGQWQRIAIARGFYKKSNMIILDEPTASIDPIEETKIYKKFQQLSNEKTSIIVTHRLGSTKLADRIVVLNKGEIVQIGTHEELVNVEGKYREMYNLQSKWYSDDGCGGIVYES